MKCACKESLFEVIIIKQSLWQTICEQPAVAATEPSFLLRVSAGTATLLVFLVIENAHNQVSSCQHNAAHLWLLYLVRADNLGNPLALFQDISQWPELQGRTLSVVLMVLVQYSRASVATEESYFFFNRPLFHSCGSFSKGQKGETLNFSCADIVGFVLSWCHTALALLVILSSRETIKQKRI